MYRRSSNNFKLAMYKLTIKVINRKIRFLRWLNTGLILPLFTIAITSTIFLYLVLFIALK